MGYRIKKSIDLKKMIYAYDDFILSNHPFADFASAAGIDKGYLSGIVNGRIDPGIKAARNICKVLKLQIDDVFDVIF
ncbi:helix-turn-helix transcriptional regulator [Clostridium sp. 'deep sea']|uniref:helix-turn-helix transcriptional regulator n=1 Tax=Clostridium sp. 'deep sea' TaxID=2779445 RepID=UPI0018966C2D|nr:helix-turn-helix transcriptional regulator [Clostridium sp. 'deep sea']QOR34097.1 helix-turn-helix transcriptional regulator [Clostridium sp. 'deep sea']